MFPDLRAWCENRRLHLVECDLRWVCSIFEHTCAYAQWAAMHRFLSGRLSVCDWTIIHDWTEMHIPGSNFYDFMNLQVADLYVICMVGSLQRQVAFLFYFILYIFFLILILLLCIVLLI